MVEDVLDPRACGARRFVDQVCIVTGAGQGIGRATARRLAQEGGKIVVEDLYQASVDRTLKELLDVGIEAIGFTGDVTKVGVTQDLMAKTKEVFGRIDVLVNVVGGTYANKPFEEYTIPEVEREIDRSLWSALWCCHSVLPYMLEQGKGAIVNLSSHSVVSTGRIPYGSAKGGVVALTTSLSKEVAARGVRINCIAPHSTVHVDELVPRDPEKAAAVARMSPEEKAAADAGAAEREARANARRANEIPMNRRADPTEQASAIAFFASEDASFITGQVLPVGGGATYR